MAVPQEVIDWLHVLESGATQSGTSADEHGNVNACALQGLPPNPQKLGTLALFRGAKGEVVYIPMD